MLSSSSKALLERRIANCDRRYNELLDYTTEGNFVGPSHMAAAAAETVKHWPLSMLSEVLRFPLTDVVILEERVEVFSQDRVSERVGDQIVDVPVPQNVEERVVEAHTSVQRHTVEQTVEISARQFAERIAQIVPSDIVVDDVMQTNLLSSAHERTTAQTINSSVFVPRKIFAR